MRSLGRVDDDNRLIPQHDLENRTILFRPLSIFLRRIHSNLSVNTTLKRAGSSYLVQIPHDRHPRGPGDALDASAIPNKLIDNKVGDQQERRNRKEYKDVHYDQMDGEEALGASTQSAGGFIFSPHSGGHVT